MRQLLKRAEAQIKRHQYNLKVKKRQAELRAARANVIEFMSLQPPIGALDIDEGSAVGHFDLPHASHRILALQGNGDTIFCKRCGCWSSRVKLRLLAEPCHGLKNGNRSSLRLLECGIMPGPDAQIPSHLKLPQCSSRRRKRGRW